MKMEDEIRRVVHSKRKGDGANFDRLLYKLRTDLSDRTKRLHRMTFQVEIVIFSELIAWRQGGANNMVSTVYKGDLSQEVTFGKECGIHTRTRWVRWASIRS